MDLEINCDTSQWRVHNRLKEVYGGSSNTLMLACPYSDIEVWVRAFKDALVSSLMFADAAIDLYDLYQRIKNDNSYEFKGPMRVPFILSGLTNGKLVYKPAQDLHLLDKDRKKKFSFKFPSYPKQFPLVLVNPNFMAAFDNQLVANDEGEDHNPTQASNQLSPSLGGGHLMIQLQSPGNGRH